MFKRFFPHKTADNVFALDADFCKKNNIKGMIFDVDNTLVTHDTLKAPQNIIDYLTKKAV